MTETVDASPAPPDEPEENVTGRLEGASNLRLFSMLAVIILFTEVVPLQYTMVSNAVQKIGPSFPSAGDNISWMIIILGLVGGATTPILGKLADLMGKKFILLASSVAFLAGSLLCATTTSWPLFLVGRGLQAVAFAMAAISAGLIRDLMPRKYVPMSIGIIATGFGVSALAAPFLTGVLTDHFSWRSIFWFLAIYMLVTIPLFYFMVPETKLKVKQDLDWLGSILVGAGAACVLVYLSNASNWGWIKITSSGYCIIGVILLVVFYLWELRAKQPIMDPKLLAAPRVAIVLAIGLFSNMIIGVQAYASAYMLETPKQHDLNNQILQAAHAKTGYPISILGHAMHFSDIGYAAGFSLMALAVHTTAWQAIPGMFSGPGAGQWAKKVGLRIPYLIALSMFTISMVLYALFHASWQEMLLIGIFYGIGFGIYYAAANNLIVEAVPQEQQGVGASMLGLTQSFGSAVGTALLTAVIIKHPFEVKAQGQPTTVIPQVYADAGWTAGFWWMALAGAICVALAFVMKAGRTPATGGTLH